MTQKVGGVEFDVKVGVDGAISASKKIIANNDAIENSFNDVDAAAKRSGDAIESGAKRGAKANSNLSRNIGMGAVQFGQFAGQVQGGQSALLAFSQQGADIGMLFGPTGMVVGGILAVGSAIAGALVPSLFEGGDAAEDLAEKLKELQKENKLTEAQTKFLAQVEMEEAKQKEENNKKTREKIKETKEMIAQISRLRAAEIKSAESGKVNSTIVGGYTESIKKLNASLTELNATLDTSEGKTGGKIVDPEALKAAQDEANSRLKIIKDSTALESEFIRNANVSNNSILLEGYSEAEAALQNRYLNEQTMLKAHHQALLEQMEENKTLIAENELLDAEEKAALVEEYRKAEIDATQNHQIKLTEIEEDAAKARVEIKKMEESAKRKAVAGAFSDMSQLMNTESRKLFEIGKTAAIASALVNGYEAAVANFKIGSSIGGPVVGAAFAAASLAATFAQIKSIQATQFGSSGSGQSIQGGQVSNNVNNGGVGPQENNRQDISISVTGGDDAGRSLLGLINMTLADGGKIGGG